MIPSKNLIAILQLSVIIILVYSSLFPVLGQQNTSSVDNSTTIMLFPSVIATDYHLTAAPADRQQLTDTMRNRNEHELTLHKVLGITTLGMSAVTILSGAVLSKRAHCALSSATTALSAATCINGYYNYGSMINFTDGEMKYNIHALAGTAATIGFLASTLLAGEDGDKSHVATGVTSGAAYAVSLICLFF